MSWIDRFALVIGRGLAWAFPVIALMMGYEVIARYGFGAPTYWAHEIAGLIAGIAFVAGGAYCMADGSHMRVTLLIDMMGRRRRIAAEVLSLACGAIFLTGLAVAMWNIGASNVWRFAADGAWNPERSGTSWNTPSPAILKAALLAGAIIFLLVVLVRAWELARGQFDPSGTVILPATDPVALPEKITGERGDER